MTKWFISDTHHGHEKCWSTFKRPDGTPLRDFSSTEEMDETILQNINKVVKYNDTIIHCGDVVISKKYLHLISRYNCKDIRLVRGNHDIFSMEDYINAGFTDILGVYVLPKIRVICSHIPLHYDSLDRWHQNWHGHLHFGTVKNKYQKPHLKYRNISVEMTEYKPIQYEELVADMERDLNIKI